jgi:hypothetical protein
MAESARRGPNSRPASSIYLSCAERLNILVTLRIAMSKSLDTNTNIALALAAFELAESAIAGAGHGRSRLVRGGYASQSPSRSSIHLAMFSMSVRANSAERASGVSLPGRKISGR